MNELTDPTIGFTDAMPSGADISGVFSDLSNEGGVVIGD